MHVLLHIGDLRGKPQFEPVHAEECTDGTLRVTYSPGLAYKVAAGDTIRVDESGKYEVLQRSGNLAVRVYFEEPIGDRLDSLIIKFTEMQGTLDGRVKRGAVFTVQARDRISKVVKVMSAFVEENADCIWEFGNVYDDHGEPLEWCKDLLRGDA